MKGLRLLLKTAFSAAFIAFLFWYVGHQDLGATFRRVEPIYLVLCLLLAPVMVAASAWKWWVVLRREGHPLPFAALYRHYLVGYFFSNFLPSNVGGDVVRSYRAGVMAGDQSAAAASIVVERLTGLLALLLLVFTLPLLRLELFRHPAVWIPAAAACAGFFAILVAGLLLGGREWKSSAAPAASSGWRARLATLAARFAARSALALSTLRRDRAYSLQILALTVLFYALALLNVWLAFRAFGVQPEWRELAALLPAAMFVAMMPVTLGSLGLAEGSYVFYFGLVGIAPAATLAMGLLLRLKILVLGVAGAVVYWRDPVKPPEKTTA